MPVISKFTVGGHSVTKYNNQRLRQFVIDGETCPFAKVAESLNGTLPDPISYRIHRLQASGNSSQATGSVPMYICQGASSVLNIGSFIKGDIYSVPITADGITATFSQSNGTYAITGTSTAQGNVLLHNTITLENGHKYLVPTFRDATEAGASNYFQWGNVYARGIPAANFYWPDQSKAQSWAIVTGNGSSGYCIFNFMSGLDTSVTGFDPSGCFNLIDLTQLYGAGNEPANPETVFQDYPEIPVGNDSWVKNDVIRSISSITLGGQTVNVDLRSAGSVYDEWASNSRGTRKCWVADNDNAYHTGSKSSSTHTNMFVIYGLGTSKATANNTVGNIVSNIFPSDTFNNLYSGAVGCAISSSGETWVSFGPDPNITTKEQADAWLAANNAQFQAEMATPTSFTAGSPLTLASGLTPTDQDGNAVTFTETTEATPSPNYPVPIVNSTLISITDGQDTNSAAVDLAGLTDKDEAWVRCYDVPNAYKQVEYIEIAAEEQWIDTGVVPKSTLKSQMKLRASQSATVGYGLRATGDSYVQEGINYRIIGYNGKFLCDMGQGIADGVNNRITGGTITANTDYTLEFGNRYLKDLTTDSMIASDTPVGAFTYPSQYTIKIGKYKDNVGTAQFIGFRVYWLKIYDGDTLIRNLFPCYRKSDSVIGLYDTVNSQFYTNAGSGSFAKGTDVPLVRTRAMVGRIDLSQCTWTQVTGTLYESQVIPNIKNPADTSTPTDAIAENYQASYSSGLSGRPYQFTIYSSKIRVNIGDGGMPDGNCYYPLSSPVWTDITSSAMGAELLALETIEETSNTMAINNSGAIDMVQYFTPI